MLAARDPFVCPVCDCVPQGIEKHITERPYKQLWEHVAKHLKRLAFFSLSYLTNDLGARASVSSGSRATDKHYQSALIGSVDGRQLIEDADISAADDSTSSVHPGGDQSYDQSNFAEPDFLSVPEDWGWLPPKPLATDWKHLQAHLKVPVNVHAEPGANLEEKINRAIAARLIRNWRDQSFLPTADLHAIFTKNLMGELVNNAKHLFTGPKKIRVEGLEDGFEGSMPEGLALHVPCLLAICIYALIPLSSFCRLVFEHNITDSCLPLMDQPPGIEGYDVEHLMTTQKKFLIYDFDEGGLERRMARGEYEVISVSQTVPIIATKKLGEGAFAVVSEVSILPAHHNFTEVSSMQRIPYQRLTVAEFLRIERAQESCASGT